MVLSLSEFLFEILYSDTCRFGGIGGGLGLWAPHAYSMTIRESSGCTASKCPTMRELIYRSSFVNIW